MFNLFNAALFRLSKDLSFKLSAISAALLSTYLVLMRYYETTVYGITDNFADTTALELIGYSTIWYAVFISLFLGRELSDGTVRNKIIVGHTRAKVYLSNLAAAGVGNAVITAALVFPAFILGVPLLKHFEHSISNFILTSVALFALSAAYAGIFTLLAMTNRLKSVSAVISIVLSIAIIL